MLVIMSGEHFNVSNVGTSGNDNDRSPFVNHSLYSADRMTHLKIVAVALMAAISMVSFATLARLSSVGEGRHATRVIEPDERSAFVYANEVLTR